MLAVPEIKELWESIQQNKENFSKQLDRWIEDARLPSTLLQWTMSTMTFCLNRRMP